MLLISRIGKVVPMFVGMEEPDVNLPQWTQSDGNILQTRLGLIFLSLILVSHYCNIDLVAAFHRKLARNRSKYPSDLCKGKSDKYTAYAQHKSSNIEPPFDTPTEYEPWCVCLPEKPWQAAASSDLLDEMEIFVAEREWHPFHTPYNLVLALCGEAGELCEAFQWKMKTLNGLEGWSLKDKTHVGEEIADCVCYLARVATQTGVGLGIESALKVLKESTSMKEFASTV